MPKGFPISVYKWGRGGLKKGRIPNSIVKPLFCPGFRKSGSPGEFFVFVAREGAGVFLKSWASLGPRALAPNTKTSHARSGGPLRANTKLGVYRTSRMRHTGGKTKLRTAEAQKPMTPGRLLASAKPGPGLKDRGSGGELENRARGRMFFALGVRFKDANRLGQLGVIPDRGPMPASVQ